jgi:8-oxo-dGTP diphosphatase
MNFPLKWEFPGGKINVGESAEDCLHRELQEELNISVTIESNFDETFYSDAEFKISLIPFVVRYKDGEIMLAEHRESRWVGKNEMRELDWAPADLPIVKRLLNSNYIK